MTSFSSIPILDLQLARDPKTKPAFLDELRRVLMEVGFLYLKNVGISEELSQKVIAEGKAFFDLPVEEKYVVINSFTSFSCVQQEVVRLEVL
jgi:isopenicillin N synthase-like dioxygenase